MASLTDVHATMLRSAVSSGRQVVHQSRRIFVGRVVSSATAADHSRHSRQLASCVKDLPCWVEGRCPFPCLRGSCKIEQNRVRYEQNRVVDKIEAQGRLYPVCS